MSGPHSAPGWQPRPGLARLVDALFRSGVGRVEFHSVVVTPLAALLAGILILLVPRLLNLIVAIYLIAIGVIGLAPHFMH